MSNVIKRYIGKPAANPTEPTPAVVATQAKLKEPSDLPVARTFEPDSLLAEAYQYYSDTNPRISSDATAKRYFATVIAFEKFLKRPPTLADLTADNYNLWVRHRRDVVGVAPSTLHGEAQKFLVIWRWLSRRREATEPLVALPRTFEAENSTWVADEWRRIEAAGRACTWFVGAIPGNIYWPAMLGVAVESGERLGAIHKLESHHFDFAKGQVTFPREIRKGKTRNLTRRISTLTASDVQALIALRPQRPFAALNQSSMYHPMRRLLCDAGLPSGRSRLFHCIRRYHATQVALKGGDPSRSLDHSDPRVTERYVDESQMPAPPIPSRNGEDQSKPEGWLDKWFRRPK